MRYSKLSGISSLLTVVVSLASATDLKPVSGAELRQQCLAHATSPQSAKGQACSGYVRGFIEGSAAIQTGRNDPGSDDESFSDRAFRTRLGVRPDPPPAYCLEATVSLSQLISQIIRLLDDQPSLLESNARDVLHRMLQRSHRCRT